MSRSDSVTSSSSSLVTLPLTTSSAQLRKIKKPLIERRRRERINICLAQLKSLVLEALDKNESSYSKMEKADILEMTVAHLKNMQQSHVVTVAKEPVITDHESANARYVLGFRECAKEVQKYISTVELSDHPRAQVEYSLVKYLESRLCEVQKVAGENQTKISQLPHSISGNLEPESKEVVPQIHQRNSSALMIAAAPVKTEQQPVVMATSPCFFICDSSVPVGISASSFSRHFAVDAKPCMQQRLFGSTLGSAAELKNRRRVQSPTEGDEFPQAIIGFKSTDSESASLRLPSRYEPKLELNSWPLIVMPKPVEDVWRPWAR